MTHALYNFVKKVLTSESYALSGDIAILTPFSVLSPPEEQEGFLLGRDERGREVRINPSRLPNMHGVVVGSTGSGKSTLARHILLQAEASNIRAWVIDPHGEEAYTRIMNARIELGEAKINVLRAPGWSPRELASELSTYAERIYSFPGYRSILREILIRCLEGESLEAFRKVKREDPNLKRIYDDLHRLHSDKGLTIEELSGRSLHFTFPTLVSKEFHALSAQILLLLLEGFMRTRGTSNKASLVVVLEEAHLLKDYFLRLFKEVRKFGLSILAVTQLPREFDPRIFQLAGFVIALSGPESYIADIASLFSLGREEFDHLAYGVRGNAILFRVGDPRPRRLILEIDPRAFSPARK
jgi:DNA helicase HerA-like ATPase